jgi:hypothetical protein
VLGVVLILGAGIYYWISQPREAPPPAALTAEAKGYVRNLGLSGVEMKATANYTGAAIVEILGQITNNGDRPLARVELNCIFYDPYGQVVLRERVPIVRSTLTPGQTREFRLPFEGIPDSWNQAMPQLVIASIQFAGQ